MLRPLIYLWTLPTTLVGLSCIVLTIPGGTRVAIVKGVIEAHGRWIAWLLRRLVPIPGGASAMTLGHVVIARSQQCLNDSRSHERIHVRQCERWGPLFIPAYFIASGIVFVRGGDSYRDNPFEREAYGNAE